MAQYNVTDARAGLSALIQKAMSGEDVIIAKDHTPLVRLVPVAWPGRRLPGSARGKIRIMPGFYTPVPDFDEYM